MDFSREDNMFFSEDYHDHVPGMTAEFPSTKVFRVGSYSGSDCERQFQSFPTPPDSPVLAELTTPNYRQAKEEQHSSDKARPVVGHSPPHDENAFGQVAHSAPGFVSSLSDNSVQHGGHAFGAQTMEMELALLESLLCTNGSSEPMDHLIEPLSYPDLVPYGCDTFGKHDLPGSFSSELPLNLATHGFGSSFAETVDDCNIPSPVPSPSPINEKEIFAGDLPNLDDLSLVSAFAQMESEPITLQYGISSAGEDSDIESDASYALPLEDSRHPFNFDHMASNMSSVLTPPPPMYHSHHHNVQPHSHYHHHQPHQQQQYQQSPYQQHLYNGVTAPTDRTHNYQRRTLHTTLKMLDAHADGIVTQESAPQQQTSCAGPIRKPYRARPRKQSVTSSDDGCSDEEQVTTSGSTSNGRTTPNRNRGRGRREAMKGNHLWEFIRDLLKSESYCPKFIRWEDRESGVFRFVNSEAVATMWGRKKNNPQMTYEKLSRAMRYYYKREILERVDGRRLVYKFGKNADGWREAAGLQ
ncbi:uncharacterized protein [Diadema antillarum]|uniref:uncharacterized protein n=1 Tax=Diadema antillarum TaxID=105358 RepID=UPI003A838534